MLSYDMASFPSNLLAGPWISHGCSTPFDSPLQRRLVNPPSLNPLRSVASPTPPLQRRLAESPLQRAHVHIAPPSRRFGQHRRRDQHRPGTTLLRPAPMLRRTRTHRSGLQQTHRPSTASDLAPSTASDLTPSDEYLELKRNGIEIGCWDIDESHVLANSMGRAATIAISVGRKFS